MYRKLLAAFVASLLAVGGLFAEEIKGAFKKFEDNKVTVLVDGNEKTFKVDPNAKTKFKDKEIELTKIFASPKLKEGMKLVLTVENDTVINGKLDKKGN
jgi:hypothetical protein